MGAIGRSRCFRSLVKRSGSACKYIAADSNGAAVIAWQDQHEWHGSNAYLEERRDLSSIAVDVLRLPELAKLEGVFSGVGRNREPARQLSATTVPNAKLNLRESILDGDTLVQLRPAQRAVAAIHGSGFDCGRRSVRHLMLFAMAEAVLASQQAGMNFQAVSDYNVTTSCSATA